MRLASVKGTPSTDTVAAAVRAGAVTVLWVMSTRLIGTSFGAHAWETETADSLGDGLVEILVVGIGSLVALIPFALLVIASTQVAARWRGPRAQKGFVAFWAVVGALLFATFAERPLLLPLLRGACVAGSVAAVVASHRLAADESPGRGRWGRRFRVASLTGFLIVARALRPPIEMVGFGPEWRVSRPIRNGLAIEAGSSSSHRLYRYDRVHYRVATGVKIWGQWGPCVLYATRDPWAACGHRLPVRVGSEHDQAWRWFLERYGEVSPEKMEEHLESVVAAMQLAETQQNDPRYRLPPSYRDPKVMGPPGR